MNPTAEVRDPASVPTFSECVIGYRAWRADEHLQLWPLRSARRPWIPGINTARCNCRSPGCLRFEWSWHEGRRVLEPAPEHVAPTDACVCGLYSLRRPRRVWYEAPPPRASGVVGVPLAVVGAVASWGHLQVHDAGFRAEHACIVTLAYHPKAPPEVLATLREIAARYGVELVPLAELEQAASCHGTPLPEGLRAPHHDPPQEHRRIDREQDVEPVSAIIPQPVPHESSGEQHPAAGVGPRATVPGRIRKAAQFAGLALIGIIALAIGLLSLSHPIAHWFFGEAHRSELPPVMGVSLLVVPVVLIGLAVQRASWDLLIDREAWRARRRNRTARTDATREH
jgi:hypothetical protein